MVVVMGVAGSGKSTVGQRLAESLGWSFGEGDDFHPPANIAKMARGTPLTDADRWPWLDAIGNWLQIEAASGRPGVVACSALKRIYRDRLRAHCPTLRLVYLEVDRDELLRRIRSRAGHFFPERLLDSQLTDLEPPSADEDAIVVPAGSVETVVQQIVPLVSASGPVGEGPHQPTKPV
jgi:carbohydrate kinase (thermoresistant glucokinase family)